MNVCLCEIILWWVLLGNYAKYSNCTMKHDHWVAHTHTNTHADFIIILFVHKTRNADTRTLLHLLQVNWVSEWCDDHHQAQCHEHSDDDLVLTMLHSQRRLDNHNDLWGDDVLVYEYIGNICSPLYTWLWLPPNEDSYFFDDCVDFVYKATVGHEKALISVCLLRAAITHSIQKDNSLWTFGQIIIKIGYLTVKRCNSEWSARVPRHIELYKRIIIMKIVSCNF